MKSMSTTKLGLLGAAAGVVIYLAGLDAHLARVGGELRPFPACFTDPGYAIINLPAQLAAAVAPILAIAPQHIGKPERQFMAEVERTWSGPAFVALGVAFYAPLGALVTAGLGGLRRALRRAA
jgi:hypothetical protein